MAGPLELDAYRPTIEVYSLPIGVGAWDDPDTTWDGAGDVWADAAGDVYAWRSVACQVSAFSSSWGADEGTGVLGQSAAGVLTLRTYDPGRILDPANTSSPLWRATRLGTPYRLTVPVGVIGYAYLDEIEYHYEDNSGTIAAADDIAKLAQANTAPGFWQPVNSLVAFAAAAIASAGQATPAGPAPLDGDPVIAWRDTRDAPVWDLIRDAATDALCLAWVDPSVDPPALRFTPYSQPVDNGLRLGDGGIELAALATIGSGAGAVNVVDDGTGELARRLTATGRDQTYSTTRIEPAGKRWADAILADRAGATVSMVPGEIRPWTPAELGQLISARGLDLVRVTLTTQPTDATLRTVGGKIEGEAGGVYRATLATYSPGAAWAYLPPAPAIPAGTPTVRVVKVTKDAGIWTSGTSQPGTNRNKGNGLGPVRVGRDTAVIGTYAALLSFDPIDYSGLRRIRKVALVLVYDRAGGAGFNVDVQRIADSWSEGRVKSTDTPTAQNGNAVVWPGPRVDAAKVTASLDASAGAGAATEIDITAIAIGNAPVNLGGRGYPEFGYRVTGLLGAANLSAWLAAKESDDDEPTSAWCRLEITGEV